MVLTEYGRSGIALLLGPSGTRPGWIGIGSGSGAVSINNSGLIYDYNQRKQFTSTDISVPKEITWVADWGSTTMSGLTLREFGLFIGSSGGTLWNREGFTAQTYDGTNELQIQITFQIF